METKDKIKTVVGSGTTAAGVATAIGGETALWSVFSAGPGAALTGAAETNAFLAWVGGGSLASGGGGMALGTLRLATIPYVGWGLALIGGVLTVRTCYKAYKRSQAEKK